MLYQPTSLSRIATGKGHKWQGLWTKLREEKNVRSSESATSPAASSQSLDKCYVRFPLCNGGNGRGSAA